MHDAWSKIQETSPPHQEPQWGGPGVECRHTSLAGDPPQSKGQQKDSTNLLQNTTPEGTSVKWRPKVEKRGKEAPGTLKEKRDTAEEAKLVPGGEA